MATQAQVDELLTKMREERAALLGQLASLGDATAERRPPEGDGEDGWSVKEQLSHLAEMDTIYRTWVERAVNEEQPRLEGTVARLPATYPVERAHSATMAEHVAELERQRGLSLRYIEGLPLAAFDRTALSPVFGELSVLQWLRSYYRHDRMHLAQIEGRQSDYEPRYVESEPDQRRRRG